MKTTTSTVVAMVGFCGPQTEDYVLAALQLQNGLTASAANALIGDAVAAGLVTETSVYGYDALVSPHYSGEWRKTA